MKVDKGFCCFACGAKGDVITFVANFFHLAPLEAAKKLAEDFRIPIFTDSSKKRNTNKEKEKPKRTLYQTEKKFEEWERESIRILSDYLHLLEEWKVSHAPKMSEEEWKAEFIEACQQTEKINYYLDLLVFGELQDRIEFLLDSGKDQRKEIPIRRRKNRKERCTRLKRNLKNGNGKVSAFYRIIFICWKNGK